MSVEDDEQIGRPFTRTMTLFALITLSRRASFLLLAKSGPLVSVDLGTLKKVNAFCDVVFACTNIGGLVTFLEWICLVLIHNI